MIGKTLLLAAATLLALTAPSKAILQIFITDGTATFSCTDGQLGCDLGGSANNLLTLNQQVGNFFVAGTLSTSVSGPNNAFDLSTFQLTNTSGVTDTLTILVGQNGFAGPVSEINMSGSVTFHDNMGIGPSSLQFFADASNAQPTLAAHGALLFTATGTPTAVVDSFDGTATAPFVDADAFAMAMRADFLLQSGAYVTGFAQGMDTVVAGAVPEPATWAMMMLGFAGVGFAAARRQRRLRLGLSG